MLRGAFLYRSKLLARGVSVTAFTLESSSLSHARSNRVRSSIILPVFSADDVLSCTNEVPLGVFALLTKAALGDRTSQSSNLACLGVTISPLDDPIEAAENRCTSKNSDPRGVLPLRGVVKSTSVICEFSSTGANDENGL